MAERKPQYHGWAAQVWDALWAVHPRGLTPRELMDTTGLSGRQIRRAAKYMRDEWAGDDPPVVYVRKANYDADVDGNSWYIAPTWADHVRSGMRSEFLQQAAARLASSGKLLKQAEKAFPTRRRQIRKVLRNVEYTRDELGDLIDAL